MNKLIDYISKKEVNFTSEELVVQTISKQLVEIYEYKKEEIKVHPQFRISCSPSDEKKKYPIDVAVFENNILKYIVECKKNSSIEGKEQLMKYLRMCEAKMGIWFNGEQILILKKIENYQGIEFKQLNWIFPRGIWEEIHPRYQDLRSRENLKKIFYQIKKDLQKKIVGSTNEPDIAKNMLRILFCKIFDERYENKNNFVRFYCKTEKFKENSKNIKSIFNEVKSKYEDVFNKKEEIELDDKIINDIIQKLQWISLKNSGRDVIADAFEIFIGTTLKGEHGQFFTPRNVVRFIINFLDIKENQKILDPACGTGGFVVESLRYIWKKMDQQLILKNWEDKEIEREKIFFAKKNIFSCDKDIFLAQTCKAYMCILGDGSSNIWNEDSLIKFTNNWEDKYDIIITNPPFGKKIMIEDKKILEKFTFWKQNKQTKSEPQILFLELCCKLLKKNGKLAIILPESSIFGNKTWKELRKTILEKYKIISIFSLPSETFQPFAGIKTSILILENVKINDDYKIIFADIKNIGHDKRGKILYKFDLNGNFIKDKDNNFIINDELEEILKKIFTNDLIYYKKAEEKNNVFYVNYSDIMKTNDLTLIPKYYNGFLNKKAEEKDNNFLILTFQDLIEKGIIEVNKNGNLPTGDEIGSLNYLNDGTVPFIRTSDISNLSIKNNPHQWTSEEIYEKYKIKQDIQPYDILFVKDGNNLVGECAIVMPKKEKIILSSGFYKIRLKISSFLIQSHITKIRIKKNNNLEINVWNFVYSLYNKKTKKQINNLLYSSTIPHLSNRIKEIKLFFPKNKKKLLENGKIMKKILENKFQINNKIKKIYEE